MIEHLIETYPEFEILDMSPYDGFCPGMPELTKSGKEDFAKTVRIFPHRMQGEGHFLALLQKGKENQVTQLKAAKKGIKKLPEDLAEFLKDISWEIDVLRLDIHGERVYYMPDDIPDVKGIRFLRTGLLLGELKKNRFEPSQALAMCLKKDEYKKTIDLSVDDDRIRRYLKGETLEVDDLVKSKDKGWYLVCVDGFPLGFGKLGNGTLKNKYLPGWRLC